jgi:hypothetical protein
MPLFVASLVVARRHRHPTTIHTPVALPLWWLLADEIAHAVHRVWRRLAAVGHPTRRAG